MKTEIEIRNEIARLWKEIEESKNRIENLSANDFDFDKKFDIEYDTQTELIKCRQVLEWVLGE